MLVSLATRIQQWDANFVCAFCPNADTPHLLVSYRDTPALAGSPLSFPWLDHEPARIEWLEEDNQYRFVHQNTTNSEAIRSTPNITSNDKEFQNVCEPFFAREKISIGEHQFKWAADTFSPITEGMSVTLHAKYATYSSMMRASDSDICATPGIEEYTLTDLKYGGTPNASELIEDLHCLVCPECEAGWYWPVNPHEIPVQHAWGVVTVECPVCSFGPIDRQYCMEASKSIENSE